MASENFHANMAEYKYIHGRGETIRNCTMCAPGSMVYRVCGKNGDTLCRPCPEDHFMNIFNNLTSCQHCRAPCAQSMRLQEIQECAPNRNRLCQCVEGYHLVSNRFCARHDKCRPGFGMEASGSATTNTRCRACGEREFSSTFSYKEKCQLRTDCEAAGMITRAFGSSNRNNICGPANATGLLSTLLTTAAAKRHDFSENLGSGANAGESSLPWLWIVLFIIVLTVMLSVIVAICVCKFGQCERLKALRAKQRAGQELSEISPVAEEQSTDFTHVSGLSESAVLLATRKEASPKPEECTPSERNVISEATERGLMLERFKLDVNDSMNQPASETETELPESIVAESSTFAYDRNVREMQSNKNISPEFLHVVIKHIAKGTTNDWRSLLRHLPDGDLVLNQEYPPDDAFAALQTWSAHCNLPILPNLVEALYCIGANDLAREVEELNPL